MGFLKLLNMEDLLPSKARWFLFQAGRSVLEAAVCRALDALAFWRSFCIAKHKLGATSQKQISTCIRHIDMSRKASCAMQFAGNLDNILLAHRSNHGSGRRTR